MTIKDRIMAVYKNELPDRYPVSIYSRYLPRGTEERQIRDMGVGIIEYYPVTTLLAPPWHMSPGYLSEVKNTEMRIGYQWENDEFLEIRSYETKVGNLYQHIRKDPVYGSDWISKYYIAEPEDYKIMQYIVENTVFRSNEKDLELKVQDMDQDGVVLGRIDRSPFQKLLIELAGSERFLIDICSGLKEAIELLEVMDLKLQQTFDIIAQSTAEVIWQPENISGEMTPPNFFNKYCMPFYEKLSKKLKGTGKPYLVHFDGRLKPLTELITVCPFSCIESFSYPEMGNDLALSEALRRWTDKVIIPNFPSSLCLKTDSDIVAYMKEKISEFSTKKSFMIQISEDIPPGQWRRILPLLCKCMNEYTRPG
jgi:hypothetical protein